MTDYLFNEEVISEAYKKSIRDEGVSEGISRGISIGERRAAAQYEAELRTLRAQIARLQSVIA